MTNRSRNGRNFLLAALAAAVAVAVGSAAHAEESDSELAKKTQNPVADLISVPLQNNFNFGVGPQDEMQYVLNVQPVIPFHVNDDWNVITRTILPLVYQPTLAPGVGEDFGLGATQFSAFLSPANSGKLVWGVGPILQMPTTTKRVLGSEMWGAGPTGVVLRMDGAWVYGALVNNVWSYAGDSDAAGINQFLLQPFLNYNLPGGTYLTTAPIVTANWKASGGDTWTVPIGGGVGRIFRLGRLPLNT